MNKSKKFAVWGNADQKIKRLLKKADNSIELKDLK